MATIVAINSQYFGDSSNKISFVGFLDGTMTALTNANGSAKITITNDRGGAVLVAAAAMTYSGTPGQWDYTGAAAAFPDFTSLSVALAGYDNTGATLYVTQDLALTPYQLPQKQYSRNSVNTFTLPAYGVPGGALRDASNSLAKLTLTKLDGTVVLAATNMTYASGAWTYSAAASLFGAGQLLLATAQGWDQTGSGTLYRTERVLMKDGG